MSLILTYWRGLTSGISQQPHTHKCMSETTSRESPHNLWSVMTSVTFLPWGWRKRISTKSHLCSTFNFFFLIWHTLIKPIQLNELTHIYNVLNRILNEHHQFRVSKSEMLHAVTIRNMTWNALSLTKHCYSESSYDCVTFHDMQTYQKVACVCGSEPYNGLDMFLFSVLL